MYKIQHLYASSTEFDVFLNEFISRGHWSKLECNVFSNIYH